MNALINEAKGKAEFKEQYNRVFIFLNNKYYNLLI